MDKLLYLGFGRIVMVWVVGNTRNTVWSLQSVVDPPGLGPVYGLQNEKKKEKVLV